MIRPLTLFVVIGLVGCGAPERAATPVVTQVPSASVAVPIELYFVRHGETISNATGVYNAAGVDTLTAKGAAQAQAIAVRMAGVHFDAAIVSPSPRAERTAQPTLAATRSKAVVWPEFEECCTEKVSLRSKPASKTLPTGGAVKVLPEFEGIISSDPNDGTMFAPASYADGEKQIKVAFSHFTRAFSKSVGRPGSVFRVLIIGHAAQGSRFLDLVLGRAPIGDIQLENGSVTVLRREPGGEFKEVSHWANSGTKGSM